MSPTEAVLRLGLRNSMAVAMCISLSICAQTYRPAYCQTSNAVIPTTVFPRDIADRLPALLPKEQAAPELPQNVTVETALHANADALDPLALEDEDESPESDAYQPMQWWASRVSQQVLERERWVSFDLETLLLDTLENSPRIKSVSHQTSATVHRIVQQDAAFDPTILLGGEIGATNDPVGNTLTTGGADRLREQSLNFSGGGRRTTRRGTELEWSQELGFLDSNSTFFIPREQGNARLSINLTKPLLSRGGQYYNERLLTQARIENRVAWHEMRGEVEQRIADVIAAYWTLYQLRVQLTQQQDLLKRGQQIERLLSSRKNFDASRIEIIRARSRVATRADRVLDLQSELEKQQVRLSALVGSEAFNGAGSELELIPSMEPTLSETNWNLRDAVAQAMENRPEIRAATHDLELSALEIRISRTELEPQLNWVFNGYLSQLNGSSQIAKSFWEQFESAPGISSGLEYELPRGRRAAKARQREAFATYRQRKENLREVLQQTQFEVETALIDLRNYGAQRVLKRTRLSRAIEQENLITVKWRLVGGDGSKVGVVLESVLDAQQRRTDAEQDLAANESDYLLALVRLQRAMGTLLINEGIRPTQGSCNADIAFVRDGVPAAKVGSDEPTVDAIPLELEQIDAVNREVNGEVGIGSENTSVTSGAGVPVDRMQSQEMPYQSMPHFYEPKVRVTPNQQMQISTPVGSPLLKELFQAPSLERPSRNDQAPRPLLRSKTPVNPVSYRIGKTSTGFPVGGHRSPATQPSQRFVKPTTRQANPASEQVVPKTFRRLPSPSMPRVSTFGSTPEIPTGSVFDYKRPSMTPPQPTPRRSSSWQLPSTGWN